jgi:hypothetical protein
VGYASFLLVTEYLIVLFRDSVLYAACFDAITDCDYVNSANCDIRVSYCCRSFVNVNMQRCSKCIDAILSKV